MCVPVAQCRPCWESLLRRSSIWVRHSGYLGPMPTASRVDRRPLPRKLTLALEGVVAELKTGTCERPFIAEPLAGVLPQAYGAVFCQTGSKEQHESPSEQGINAEPRP